jgi:hypothetical protein
MNIILKKSWELPESAATSESVFRNRREFLAGLVGGGFALGTGAFPRNAVATEYP